MFCQCAVHHNTDANWHLSAKRLDTHTHRPQTAASCCSLLLHWTFSWDEILSFKWFSSATNGWEAPSPHQPIPFLLLGLWVHRCQPGPLLHCTDTYCILLKKMKAESIQKTLGFCTGLSQQPATLSGTQRPNAWRVSSGLVNECRSS